jgi:hypothetical protein
MRIGEGSRLVGFDRCDEQLLVTVLEPIVGFLWEFHTSILIDTFD